MSLTPDIERVLSEHTPVPCAVHNRFGSCYWFCCDGCDWRSDDTAERRLPDHEAAHRRHLAEQIAALVEQREEAAK